MRVIFSIIIVCLTSVAIIAQPTYSNTTSKKASKLFNEAQSNFGLGRIDMAIELSEQAMAEDENFVDAASFAATMYLDFKQDYVKAEERFATVLDIEPEPKAMIYFGYGKALFNNQKYDDAKKNLEKYMNHEAAASKVKMKAEVLIASCDFIPEAMENPVPFEPKNLGNNINTEYMDYFPALTADEQQLYYTNGQFGKRGTEDIYVAKKRSDGKWEKSKALSSPINKPYSNEGAHTISVDGKYLIYTICNDGNCDIYLSRKEGNIWTLPRNIGDNVNTGGWESQPSLSADNKALYFVRGTSRDEYGRRQGDIFVSYLGDEGFSKAVKLDATINTFGNEERPFIHPDGKTLYFTSDGHPGMGDGDIYYSKLGEDGKWGEPVNMGYPINTSGYEAGMFVSADGSKAYFASEREGGFGGWDIYYFEMPEEAKPEIVTWIKGKVFDKETKEPLRANVQLIDIETGKTIASTTSDPKNGAFLQTIVSGKDYMYNVSLDGYLFYSDNFSLAEHNPTKPYELEIGLEKIKEGVSIVMKNIFFETGKYDLLPTSKTELDKLVTLLSENTSMKIEIGGHTDNIGDDADNKTLSNNRAKAVNDYLVENGIAADRLTYKGYGEDDPIASNDSEEGRAKNRRTEFTVTGR